jgi:hypothetical protein
MSSIEVFDITAIDWSSLRHAYGSAADMPDVWRAFLEQREERGGGLLHTISHQGTVYSATPVLTPHVIAVAKSAHPARAAALDVLGAILRTTGGPLETDLRTSAFRAATRIRNPATGEIMSLARPEPDAAALDAERAWVEELGRSIEAEIDALLPLITDPDWKVRVAMAYLVAGVRFTIDAPEPREVLETALAAATTDEERRALEHLLEELDMADDADDEDDDVEDDEEDQDDEEDDHD